MKKHILIFSISFLLLAFSFSTNSVNINGTWTANCVIKRLDPSSISHCALCPVTPVNTSSIELNSFKIAISDKTLSLTRLDETTKIGYSYVDDSLSFKYKNEEYTFKAFSTTDKDIKLLKDHQGMSIILTRVSE